MTAEAQVQQLCLWSHYAIAPVYTQNKSTATRASSFLHIWDEDSASVCLANGYNDMPVWVCYL